MALLSDMRRKWLASSLEREAAEGRRRRLPGRLAALPRWAVWLLGAVIFLILYWGLLGWILSDTSANLALRPDAEALRPGGSVTVAMASTLTRDAAGRAGWTPNDGLLRPTAFLDEMPAYQRGQMAVLSAMSAALTRASLEDDAVMDAADDYAVPPTRGFLNGDFPFIGGSAGARYLDGAAALDAYNARLSRGDATVLKSPVQVGLLMRAVDRVLARQAGQTDRLIRGGGAPAEAGETEDPLGSVAVEYQETRGMAYAATLLLRGMRSDFEPVLRQRQLGSTMVAATETLDRIVATEPLFIGRADVVEQAYYLGQALAAMRDIQAEVSQ